MNISVSANCHSFFHKILYNSLQMLNEFKNRFILIRNARGIQQVRNVLAIKSLQKSRQMKR
ncbi:hypothetical protein HMPREF0971_01587 [Segatella oris F0302]|uniref:Uncharacterized protein n=1 Tax=Segatella oris F0302 TaxID=649760 RepID=D1QRI2_9BACT|nr:hypothetical protein HMPREF0971_01587 [Segatella oris F0302]